VRRVEQQQYRVDVSDSKKEAATVQCHFSRTRDLMFVLLPREARLLPLRCRVLWLGASVHLQKSQDLRFDCTSVPATGEPAAEFSTTASDAG